MYLHSGTLLLHRRNLSAFYLSSDWCSRMACWQENVVVDYSTNIALKLNNDNNNGNNDDSNHDDDDDDDDDNDDNTTNCATKMKISFTIHPVSISFLIRSDFQILNISAKYWFLPLFTPLYKNGLCAFKYIVFIIHKRYTLDRGIDQIVKQLSHVFGS